MSKEEFLTELNKNLKYLKSKYRKEELKNYETIEINNLDPIEVANQIYEKRGIKITINQKIKFLEAINIIINGLRSKDKEILKKILLFFLYLFFLLIIIKIPFIYTRDMILNLFNNWFTNNNVYIAWNLLFEFLYAITTIIIFIRLIKKKAMELKNANKNLDK